MAPRPLGPAWHAAELTTRLATAAFVTVEPDTIFLFRSIVGHTGNLSGKGRKQRRWQGRLSGQDLWTRCGNIFPGGARRRLVIR
jgi:hypothetical protein